MSTGQLVVISQCEISQMHHCDSKEQLFSEKVGVSQQKLAPYIPVSFITQYLQYPRTFDNLYFVSIECQEACFTLPSKHVQKDRSKLLLSITVKI